MNVDSGGRNCVACLSSSLRFYGRREGYSYYECMCCATVQLAPLPAWEDLRAAYARGYEDANHMQAGVEERTRAMARQFESVAQTAADWTSEGTVLDVGAGWGGLMQMLDAAGVACEGLELSETCAAYCAQAGLPVFQKDLTAMEGERRYAALAFCCVFEHLVNHEEVLRHAHRLLSENGLLISLQPTALFARPLGHILRFGIRSRVLPRIHHTYCPPWHTVIFSLDGMTRLLERNGFELVEIRPGPQQRDGGAIGVAQRILERVNRAGWRAFRARWPLIIGHIFVFRKKACV